jgi:DNA-directed RNA polymerase I and III subunit RPAC2
MDKFFVGNSLRFILAQRSDVEFVGYSIPHPSENRLNLRLQTAGRDAGEVLQEG